MLSSGGSFGTIVANGNKSNEITLSKSGRFLRIHGFFEQG
jgi:hypothetical protein